MRVVVLRTRVVRDRVPRRRFEGLEISVGEVVRYPGHVSIASTHPVVHGVRYGVAGARRGRPPVITVIQAALRVHLRRQQT